MERICLRCDRVFDAATPRAYCPGCVEWFRSNERFAAKKAHPDWAFHVTGKFNDPAWCPRSMDAGGACVCGLCGGDALEPGYGFAGGYGLGCYQFCTDCGSVLDFAEDSGD